jgi:hydroxyacylglutathione hydrolase
MEIVPVKAFKDNYVWTLRNETHAAVVDPGEARPVLDYLGRENLKLAALPDDTKVYCGHEYTLANIGFARAVEPQNTALNAREARDRRLRDAGKPTLPSTLADEKATNPFLRCREPAVIESANKYLGARLADPVRVFAAIRDWKNRF